MSIISSEPGITIGDSLVQTVKYAGGMTAAKIRYVNMYLYVEMLYQSNTRLGATPMEAQVDVMKVLFAAYSKLNTDGILIPSLPFDDVVIITERNGRTVNIVPAKRREGCVGRLRYLNPGNNARRLFLGSRYLGYGAVCFVGVPRAAVKIDRDT